MRKLLIDNDLGLPNNSKTEKMIMRAIKSIAGINRLNNLYAKTQGEGAQFASSCLEKLHISYQCNEQSRANIPQSGAFIIVANLPHGILDGLLLMDLVLNIRPDTKIVAGFVASQIEAIKGSIINVENFEEANQSSFHGIREAKNHLAAGHPLIIFPAQKLASFNAKRKNFNETKWNRSSIKFIRQSNVPLIPIHINGYNSLMFRLLGHVNSKLQITRVGHELLSKEGHNYTIEVGSEIDQPILNKLGSTVQLEAYLRSNITLLAHRKKINNQPPSPSTKAETASRQQIENISTDQFPDQLTPQNYLLTADNINFYFIESNKIETDEQKNNPTNKYIIGFEQQSGQAACMVEVRYGDRSMLEYGIDGLYTHAYFEYSHKHFDTIRRSIEIGERQVSHNHSNNEQIAQLIWQSAIILLAREEQYRYLIGTSGIAADYSNLAKLMITSYIRAHAESKLFTNMAIARHSAKRYYRQLFEGGVINELKDPEITNKLISDSDSNHEAMPRTLEVLLSQGAHVLALSINQKDKNKLNALMILDIEEIRQNVPRGTKG